MNDADDIKWPDAKEPMVMTTRDETSITHHFINTELTVRFDAINYEIQCFVGGSRIKLNESEIKYLYKALKDFIEYKDKL